MLTMTEAVFPLDTTVMEKLKGATKKRTKNAEL